MVVWKIEGLLRYILIYVVGVVLSEELLIDVVFF